MNKTLLKSIWALLAGFIVVVILSIITDTALMQSGIMKQPLEQNSNFFIGLIVLYRSLFSITGSYITARLAPNKPMRHAMIGGAIGLILYSRGHRELG
jgi:hypothetical protein